MSNAESFMKRAIDLSKAKMESGCGGPFGAVIVKDGKIVGEGWNKVTSTNDPTAHAEVEAIRDASKNLSTFDLSGCEIYTSCEPCPMCLSAIYWSRLSKIYYANTKTDAAEIDFADDFIYQEFAKNAKQRSIPMTRMMENEAIKIFQLWDQKADKIAY